MKYRMQTIAGKKLAMIIVCLIYNASGVYARSDISGTYSNTLDAISSIQSFLLPFYIAFGLIALIVVFVKPLYGVILTLIVSPFINSSSGISISELGLALILIGMLAAYLVHYKKSITTFKGMQNPEWLLILFSIYLIFSSFIAYFNGTEPLDSIRDMVSISNLIVFVIVIRFAEQKKDVDMILRYQYGILVFLGIKTTLEINNIWVFGRLLSGQADPMLMIAFLVFNLAQLISNAKGRKYYIACICISLVYFITNTNRTQFILALFTVAFMILMVRRSRRVIAFTIISVILFGGLYVAAQVIAKPIMEQKEAKLKKGFSGVDLSVKNRIDEMQQCFEIFKRSPIVGVGIGYKYRFWRHFVRGVGQGYQIGNYTHSDFMFLLSKTGIIGTGIFMAFLFSTCRISWIVWKKAPIYEIRLRGLSILTIIIASQIMAQSMPVLQVRSTTYFLAMLMAYAFCLHRDYVVKPASEVLAYEQVTKHGMRAQVAT